MDGYKQLNINIQENNGFARILTILIFFTFIFAMTGFDLRAFVDSDEFSNHVQNIRSFIVDDAYAGYIKPVYGTYIQPSASFAWSNIIDEAIVRTLQDNTARVAVGDGTDFGRTIGKMKNSI